MFNLSPFLNIGTISANLRICGNSLVLIAVFIQFAMYLQPLSFKIFIIFIGIAPLPFWILFIVVLTVSRATNLKSNFSVSGKCDRIFKMLGWL